MSGYDVVLLKSLESGLQSSEYQIMPHLLKCLLSLISKIQMKHLNKKNSLEVNVIIFLLKLYLFTYKLLNYFLVDKV